MTKIWIANFIDPLKLDNPFASYFSLIELDNFFCHTSFGGRQNKHKRVSKVV